MNTRQIVLDTETTGFGADDHRIIEIGCVEMVGGLPTGNTFHQYLNPERDIDPGAIRVHGITNERVANEPLFADVAQNFLDFIGNDELIIHNATFDMEFLNAELARCNREPLGNPVTDTLLVARTKLPGQRHSLDALCRHYGIDNSGRTYHGALLDSQLLAEVYIELHGGLQGTMVLETVTETMVEVTTTTTTTTFAFPTPQPTAEETATHTTLLTKTMKSHRWPVTPTEPPAQ
jgi:DNA polymerase III subunit epsilon